MQIIESVCRLLTREMHQQVNTHVCKDACRLEGKTKKVKMQKYAHEHDDGGNKMMYLSFHGATQTSGA